MAESNTGRLCVQIIHSHFGPITASVASALLTRGRLPLPQLVRITGHKPRTVLSSILVLIQHNLIWHARTEDDGEVLEVNVDECLMRLRFGRFVWQAEDLFGKAASEIVQIILDHGKLRPPDILTHLGAYDPKTVKAYTQAIHKLVSTSYLKPSTILSHVSPRDKRIQYEAEEKMKIVGFPTAKEIREAKEVAEARLKREEEEAEQVGLKRKAKETAPHRPTKRKAVEEEEYVVEDTVYFRVNFDKFNIHIRNSLIVKAAKERYNSGAGLVMQAALKVTESTQKSVSEVRSDPMSVANIVLRLSDNVDLSSGLVFASSKKPSNSTCIKEYLGMLSSADNPTPAGRAGAFVSYSSSKVQVEFEIVGRRLRRRVLESVARERHGVEGVRILRLLLDTGKMDEKQVSKIVMMAPKDVRPLLAALAADSLISTQEVPKSADRNPTRTFYLWYVDLHKAYSVILGNLHKTLYNIGMRRRAEEEASEVKGVLEKRERSDVSQDESLLSRLERDILKEWEAKQKRLTVLEMRVEETVFVLQDLAVLGINDD
ncbi:RNA polymerase III subunit RPC82-domain-containing protein [Lyophyllum atratum]|nr:RNA polymerase III subunit RPC82-domain-containing protein [Lyophyllum atratum]